MANPADAVSPTAVMACDGTLALVKGAVKRLTVAPNVDAKRSPAGLKRSAPVFGPAPLAKLADGVLAPEMGAAKNCRFPRKSPMATLPAALTATDVVLFAANVKFGVELPVMGRVNC